MGSVFSQTSRMGRLTTILGPDTLALMRFDGREALNGLFDWQVYCLATSANIDFDALIGTHATVTLVTRQGERPFDGIVTEARWLGAGENGYRYRLVLRPWVYLAGLRRNQRIFHRKTVVVILEELLGAYATAGALRVDLAADYPELEYTVQYRESDLDFACRLMERHGISYHFQHAAGAHSMVLTDLADNHPTIGARPYLPYDGHHQQDIDHFWEWHPARRITTGAIRLTDYNFKTPNAAMEADHTGDAAYTEGQIESFDWPGGHPDLARGQLLAHLRTDGERGQDRRFEAVGDIAALGAGCRVALSGDPVPGSGEGYLCLTASHSYTSDSYGSGGESGDGYAYSGRYVLMPATAPMVPEQKTPRADVKGPQTAVVVGEGEIDCDEYGRILLRFHWDLDAAHSMRCRVSQNWAGNGWGGMVIPRIGMEVVVEFLDGDPDQPLVTGCVYNGRNTVPYDLPENKTRSTFKTKTHEGTGFNELTFEDKTGEERVYLHAQRDHEIHVQNNRSKRVDVSEVSSIGNSKYSEIGKDLNMQVGGNVVTAIGVPEVSLGATRPMEAYDDGPLQLAYQTTIPGKPDAGAGHYKLTVAQSRTEIIGTQSNLRVGDSSVVAVGTDMQINIGAKKTESTGDNSYETVGGGRYMHVTKEIDLRCGSARLVMHSSGEIEITGTHIRLRADKIDLN